MCRWAEVSESGFYAWRRKTPSEMSQRQAILDGEISRVFEASNRIYGYRKIAAKLASEGISVCERTVAKTMRRLGLESCHPAPWRHLTMADGSAVAEDLIGRDFTAERPGVRFVGDITQINTWEGPLYLSTMIDLFNREIVGYAMDDNYAAPLVCSTVNMAAVNGRIRAGGIFHSDHGSQYTSKAFRDCLGAVGMFGSMGRVGSCFDNAAAETWFATLKKELVHRTVFPTRQHAIAAVTNFIEIWYNRKRLHSVLGYQTPAEFREQYQQTNQAA